MYLHTSYRYYTQVHLATYSFTGIVCIRYVASLYTYPLPTQTHLTLYVQLYNHQLVTDAVIDGDDDDDNNDNNNNNDDGCGGDGGQEEGTLTQNTGSC